MKAFTRKVLRLIKFLANQASIPLAYRLGQTRLCQTTPSVDDFFACNLPVGCSAKSARSLDIGCGTSIRNPFNASELYGIDIRENDDEKIICLDLNVEPIPFPDNYFDYVTAYDFLELVPRVCCYEKTRFPFIELMGEISRVLKAGGLFFSHTPAYPAKQAFQDPTHVNIITEDTIPLYFCGDAAWAKMYGFSGSFELIAQEWHDCWLLTAVRKVE